MILMPGTFVQTDGITGIFCFLLFSHGGKYNDAAAFAIAAD